MDRKQKVLNAINILAISLALACLTACGQGFEAIDHHLSDEPPVMVPGPDNVVVKSRAVYFVSTENGQTVVKMISNFIFPLAYAANPTSVPISFVNAPNASMTVDTALFVAPALPVFDSASYGSLKITTLKDNNLKVCGVGGNTKCGTALIRMYTTGTAGAGLYNAADGYGATISAGLSTTRATVGLTSANSAVVQTYTIPANKNNIRETDFSPAVMQYNVDVDFSNAGAGTYTTTLVVEYGLAL
jgi:hypothetical protein